MRKPRPYVSIALFGGLALVLFAMLALLTVRNAARDKALLRQNVMTQGYWIARSLEIGHSMMMYDHTKALRDLMRDIATRPDVRFLAVLDRRKRVMIASDAALEGTLWPAEFADPPEAGRILTNVSGTLHVVFPAFFAATFQRMQHHHPAANDTLVQARWIVLGLDASDAQAHYRDLVVQSVLVSLGIVLLGLTAFWFLGMIQRYQLASASLEHLEQIRHHLARFVPGAVQKLIEANPEHPRLAKVEQDATVLFLDIDHYTAISESLAPEALNRLIETYFAAFLDIILAHGGEINETAGDSLMAIVTGKTPRVHAWNAVQAAMAIRERVDALNRAKQPSEPDIQVNIGINTGQVWLGATMITGAVGERLTYTASGMVTNIASRLCELGSKGEIHLSPTTARLVMDQIKLHGPWMVHLKHVPGAVPVYKLA
jgi:class 3 adenylate cyclase